MKSRTVEIGWTYNDLDYRVTAKVSGGSPGRTYGPPENCYPPEDPEVEIDEVRGDWYGSPAFPELEGVAERDDSLLDEIIMQASEDEVADAYDAAESREEAYREQRQTLVRYWKGRV